VDEVERLIDVAEKAAVVKVAVAALEVLVQEGGIVAFLEVIEPARPALRPRA
jgi:hypothetical protein